MQLNFKKILRSGFWGLLIIGALIPLWIFAQNANENQKAKVFCTAISNLASKFEQRVTNYKTKLEEKRAEIASNFAVKWHERDTKLAEKRNKWDINHNEHFTKLEQKAITDQQKQALVTFKEAVTTAISARRTAIDAAIQTFRQGVNSAIASRKNAVDGAIGDLTNSIIAAVDKAKTDCQNGVDPATVRQALKADLKSAQEKYVSDRQKIDKLQSQIEPLLDTRNQAIEKAIADFKSAMEKAKSDFKAAFSSETALSEK